MTPPIAALLCGVALATPTAAGDDPAPDRVELENGKVREGRVLYEDAEVVVLLDGTREETFARDEVAHVDSVARHLDELLGLHERMAGAGAAELAELADHAEARRLPGEAVLLRHLALARDPLFAPAHEALGHRLGDDAWQVRVGRTWVDFDEIDGRRGDWSDAWELETTHFRLRANLGRVEAVHAALDLELLWRALKRAFPELKLREPRRAIGIRLHADAVSYPDIGAGRSGYTTKAELEVEVHWGTEHPRWVLFHEALHVLLYASAETRRADAADIPPWFNEGLADLVAASVRGEPGRAWFELDEPYLPHYRLQRDEKKPYRLDRVVTFAVNDFMGSTKAQLKYAQCTTLVDYLLRGEGGALRAGFLEYVRESLYGGGGLKDLLRAVGRKEKELEKGWTAWVEEVAEAGR